MTERQRLAHDLVVKQKKTYEEAGRILGVSRQYIHQLLTGYQPPSHRKFLVKQGSKAA
jgi:DNA-directed RNA polymerase specialized sigma subunit